MRTPLIFFSSLCFSLCVIPGLTLAATIHWSDMPVSVATYPLNTPTAITLLASSGKKWEELSPDEKKKLSKKRQKYEKLPPEKQERIRKARKKYQKLPKQERETLRKKWKKMTPQEKKKYRLEQGYRG